MSTIFRWIPLDAERRDAEQNEWAERGKFIRAMSGYGLYSLLMEKP